MISTMHDKIKVFDSIRIFQLKIKDKYKKKKNNVRAISMTATILLFKFTKVREKTSS